MINDFVVLKLKHEIFDNEYYPRFNFLKNLHWSFKKEWTHRGWDYVPNHIRKVAE